MSTAVEQPRSPPEPAHRTELSIVLPTFQEKGNVAELIRRLDSALAGVEWEAIFVDDNSPDGTAEAAKRIAATDLRVRCLAGGPARPRRRLHRGHAVVERAIRCGDGRRSAA